MGKPECCSSIGNAVTSLKTLLNGYSVKIMLHKVPTSYFIVIASFVKTFKVKAIEFHRIQEQIVCMTSRLNLRYF